MSIHDLIIFKLPMDLLGALMGGIVGFVLVKLWDLYSKPKVKILGFVNTNFNCGGELIKLKFKITGKQNPGVCQLELQWCDNSVKAKWDEAPNPIKNDDCNEFKPELVPATFYQPLFLNKEYNVPIIHKENINSVEKFTVFSGWWFGREKGYGPDPSIKKCCRLKITLSGNNFEYSKEYKVKKIINNHDTA